MVPIVQLVRMSDCGSEGRGFEPHLAPFKVLKIFFRTFFVVNRKGIQNGNVDKTGSPGKPWLRRA